MLRFFILLLLILSPFCLPAQDAAVLDSLHRQIAQARHDSTRVQALNGLSWEYRNANPEKAMQLARQALALAVRSSYQRGEGNAHQSIGIVYWLKGEHSQGLKHLFTSLSILEGIRDKSGMAFSMNYIGNIYNAQENYAEALKYLFRALEIYRELGDMFRVSVCLNNIGDNYMDQENYADALKYLFQALSISQQIPHEELGSFARSNIGEIYLAQGDYQQARRYLMEALIVSRQKNTHYLTAGITNSIGLSYFKSGDLQKAEDFALQGLEVSRTNQLKDHLKDACQQLADIYAAKNDFKNAYKYQVLFAAYRDSLSDKQTAEKISSERLTHELDKKQMQINLLQQSAELDQYLRYSLMAALMVTFLMAFVMFYNYRQKVRTNLTLLQQQQEILAKNQEIASQGNNILEKSEKLEKANADIQTLSRIGMEITSTLNIETILHILYGHVNQLMPAEIFGIGIYQPEKEEIKIMLVMHPGQQHALYHRDMQDKNQLAVWCIENKKALLIHDIHSEYRHYIAQYVERKILLDDDSLVPECRAMLYCPLLLKDRVLRIVSVQSGQSHAYNELHLEMLRTLAAYTAIALDNAQTYNKLDQAMQQLKATQAQLVQSEKMASLGQLTAGIAHEINNPVNFIYAGSNSLRTNFAEILEVLAAYQRLTPENASQQLPVIEQLTQDMQLTELCNEARELLGSIYRGAERTAEIVKGLRTFSRLDEDSLKMVDLHENMDATLVMLRNQYKDRIEVLRNYGYLPRIECYPGKLNQVFMNILSNAIHAIKGQGRIEISTAIKGNIARISIKDTGKGMNEEVKKHIFEPFFTTKDVGEGTGLGLSISHSIIEKHHGSIEVESREGQGSCFTIYLPIKH